MAEKPNTVRNRAIFAAAAAGQSIEHLAQLFCLAPTSIRAIMADEGHRRAVSVDAYYRDMRRPETQRRAAARKDNSALVAAQNQMSLPTS